MIFDWSQNSLKILANKTYTREDSWDNKCILLQEIRFIQYLILQKKTEEDIYAIWVGIAGGMAEQFSYEKDQCQIEFRILYKKALRTIKDYRENKSFAIYQEEIDYLNSLDAPLWVRQYWLGLLFWYKFELTYEKKAYTNTLVEGWIFYQIDHEHEYRRKSGEIIKWNRHCKTPIKRDVKSKKSFLVLKWAKKNGNIVGQSNSPKDFLNYLNLLREGTRVCPICGSYYDFTSKTKRKICESCWRKKETERVRAYNRLKGPNYKE